MHLHCCIIHGQLPTNVTNLGYKRISLIPNGKYSPFDRASFDSIPLLHWENQSSVRGSSRWSSNQLNQSTHHMKPLCTKSRHHPRVYWFKLHVWSGARHLHSVLCWMNPRLAGLAGIAGNVCSCHWTTFGCEPDSVSAPPSFRSEVGGACLARWLI